ncbi:cysteine desulfurase family protein [Siminovitchia sediminis]|uniref:cysteine desulfurase n=1 Tax=Siminovitchia sediminis TaxID=1274353 RepID=A0ABW4KED6_9BACI
MRKIYLDHAATTPVHPRAAEKMISVMNEIFGNPSSIHSFGRLARQVLDESRSIIARTLHASDQEIVFTSGGTEADNLAVAGTAFANQSKGRHIITTAFEHHAVLHACQFLEKAGFKVTYLQPDAEGLIHAKDVEAALREDTILVSIMFVNNEVGTIQPIKEIGSLLADHQAYFHTDAVQAYGTEEIHVKDLQVDLLSVTAHKINGPKGVGCLYIKNGSGIEPLLYGGEQELKRRPGTENLVSICGFAEAASIAAAERREKRRTYEKVKEAFIQTLESDNIDFTVNGSQKHAVPHVLNISFPGTEVESFLVNLDLAGIAASSGSACTAGSIEPSHVLTAMFGEESERGRNSIRFSFGIDTTVEKAEEAAGKTADIVRRLIM